MQTYLESGNSRLELTTGVVAKGLRSMAAMGAMDGSDENDERGEGTDDGEMHSLSYFEEEGWQRKFAVREIRGRWNGRMKTGQEIIKPQI